MLQRGPTWPVGCASWPQLLWASVGCLNDARPDRSGALEQEQSPEQGNVASTMPDLTGRVRLAGQFLRKARDLASTMPDLTGRVRHT